MNRRQDDLKESRLQNKPHIEDVSSLKQTEFHLNSEIQKLKADLRILTEINRRINAELSFYQNKFGTSPSEKVLIKSEGHDIASLPHELYEFDFLLPLFKAYDDKTAALERAVRKIFSRGK